MAISKKPVIRELKAQELKSAYALISQLRPELSLEQYMDLIKAMEPAGYRAVGLFEDEEIVAYAGFAEQVNLYYGRHIWVYDLVTKEERRGRGYGEALLSHIEAYGKQRELRCVALSSGVKREKTHRFYENKMKYDIVSYVFKKAL